MTQKELHRRLLAYDKDVLAFAISTLLVDIGEDQQVKTLQKMKETDDARKYHRYYAKYMELEEAFSKLSIKQKRSAKGQDMLKKIHRLSSQIVNNPAYIKAKSEVEQ